MSVEIIAVRGRGQMTLRELATMEVDDIVQLRCASDESVELTVGGRTLTRTALVVVKGRAGLRIVAPIAQEGDAGVSPSAVARVNPITATPVRSGSVEPDRGRGRANAVQGNLSQRSAARDPDGEATRAEGTGRQAVPGLSGVQEAAPVAAPTAPVAAPTAPIAAPTAPIAAPTAPIAAPTAPIAAPTAPIAAPTAPIAAPTAPIAVTPLCADVGTGIPRRAAEHAQEVVGGEGWLSVLGVGRYSAIGHALATLSREAAAIARGLQDPGNRRHCLRLVTDELLLRLERFATLRDAPEENMYAAWVEPDLLPILNGVSELYSMAVREGRRGNASAGPTAAFLHGLLYRDLSAACSDAGWFGLQVVVPYETDFDPAQHFAIGSEESSASNGKIVDIRQVGRTSSPEGAVIAPAHVVVGH